jgi:predicted CoA-binding protein
MNVMASLPQSDPILDLLKRSKTIAVVGLSSSPLRPSHGVSAYMQTHGYRIIPVNPKITEALGEEAYPTLLDIPEKIDIVNIFRRPEYVEEIVDQAIHRKVPAIWMQEQVINEKAAEKARNAGIFVVMDRCILKEHKLRLG